MQNARESLHDHHHVQYLPNPQHACNLWAPLPLPSTFFQEFGQVLGHCCALPVRNRIHGRGYVSRKCKPSKLDTPLCKQRKRHPIPTVSTCQRRRRWSAAVSFACRPYTTSTSMTQQATSTTSGAQTTAATSLPPFYHSKLRLHVPNVTLPSLKQHLFAMYPTRFLSRICCQTLPSQIKLSVASNKLDHAHT